MVYEYYLIDAFSSMAFQGAPIAVFTQANGLHENDMQLIARELNQTETVFIVSELSSKEISLRIFTPNNEVEFGGHPIIAASYILFKNEIIKQGSGQLKLPIGLIDINVSDKGVVQFSVDAQTKLDYFVPSAKELAELVHLDENDIDLSSLQPMISACGDSYLIVPVKSIDVVNKAKFSEEKWTMSFVATLAKQIILFCENKEEGGVNYNARLYGKGINENEDPPIGTAAPAFGNYIFSDKKDGEFNVRVQRGSGNKRISIIDVEVHKDLNVVSKIKVGGKAVVVGEGKIFIN